MEHQFLLLVGFAGISVVYLIGAALWLFASGGKRRAGIVVMASSGVALVVLGEVTGGAHGALFCAGMAGVGAFGAWFRPWLDKKLHPDR